METNVNSIQFGNGSNTDTAVVGTQTVTVLEKDANGKFLKLSGATLPTAGADCAVGCQFILTSGAAGTTTYVNEGTTTTASWAKAVQTGYAELTLTAAQVKALRATPQTLVAAPGAGKFLEFVSGALALVYGGSNVFTESTANLAVKYTNGSGVQVSQTIESTGFIDQSASTQTSALPKIDAIVTVANAANAALVLHNLGAGEIAGNAANDNTLKIKITYRVHTL